jgi:hypothetical protein
MESVPLLLNGYPGRVWLVREHEDFLETREIHRGRDLHALEQ